ncbi:MAG TPA: hypothetical protein VLE43_04805 [Candidatus Saccharimonadia bacterium]|nr:hypothetical protein [Candidatus Saccharimonadia bacterium]
MAAGSYKFLNVPLTEEEMNALREVSQKEGRSMGRQFRMYGVEHLAADARRLGVPIPSSADMPHDGTPAAGAAAGAVG